MTDFNPASFNPSSTLYPFASRWFDSAAGRVHYLDEGDGPPILFCHGSPTWSFLFRRSVRELRSRYRCIAADMLGFGLSERPDRFGYSIEGEAGVLAELVDHLGLDDFIVVGHDWGGPVGLRVAVERADRVRGVALTNTQYWPVERPLNRVFSSVMGSRVMRRPIVQRNLLIERFLVRELREHLSPAELNHYRGVQDSPEQRIALTVMPREIRSARTLLEDLSDSVPATLGGLPALAVWGMRDPVFPPGHCLPRIRADFADLQVVELPYARHFVPEEAPDEFAAALERRFGR